MTTREMLNRCKHEIQELRQTIAYLKPRADAYDNLAIVLNLLPRTSQGFGEDIIWVIQKRIDELTSKPEANPTPTPTQGQVVKPATIEELDAILNQPEPDKFDPDPYSAKLNKTPEAQPTARGYIDA